MLAIVAISNLFLSIHLSMHTNIIKISPYSHLPKSWRKSHKKATPIYLLKFTYFNWRMITILWWFLPYINMNLPRVYISPPSWTHLPPLYPPYPSGLSQSTDFGCPTSCIKLALVIYFTYVNVYVSSYSLKSSHFHLLPLSPKVCSLHQSPLLPCM